MAENFSHNLTVQKRSVMGAGGMVAAQHGGAARIGARILENGGNAMDAAIATAFALGVAEPWMSGLGGSGLMVVHVPERNGRPANTCVVDFTAIAPAGLDPARYPLVDGVGGGLYGWPAVREDRNVYGAEALSVPGFVAGMGLAHGEFGHLPWSDLLQPAVEMARRGLALDWYACLMIADAARVLAKQETARAVFLPDGLPPTVPGMPDADDRLVMPGLAETLETLRDSGAEAFYTGALAASIAADVQAAGGCLTVEDLGSYAARLVDPLIIPHETGEIWTTPGLNAGPSLANAIANLRRDRRKLIPDGGFYLSMANALRETYAHRLAHMGAQAETRMEDCTTHLAAVDREGMVVSLTNTLVSPFGCGLLLPGSGILMNNAISWFDPVPGRPNSLAAGERGLNNMCPVIGRRRDGCLFALGASGGRRILGAVAQVLCFLTDYRLDLEESLRQPRINVSGSNGMLTADPDIGEDAISQLRDQFSVHVKRRVAQPPWYANVCAVLRHEGINHAGAEPALPWADAVAEQEDG